MNGNASIESWNDIEYSCSQLQNECGVDRIPDIFSTDFMHHYTTFISFDTMLMTMQRDSAEVQEITDLVEMDTPANDACVAQFTEFATWRDLVTTACSYYLARNLA